MPEDEEKLYAYLNKHMHWYSLDAQTHTDILMCTCMQKHTHSYLHMLSIRNLILFIDLVILSTTHDISVRKKCIPDCESSKLRQGREGWVS